MNPFDADELWLKSRLFVNRTFDPHRDFYERAFWACSALELLGKSALSRISPLLTANPMDDGLSLLVASGTTLGSATSVQAKAVWSRCNRIFKPFNDDEAKKLSIGRNEYIHSALIGFTKIPPNAWWPRYWAQVDILLRHMGKSIDEYIDRSELPLVEKALQSRQAHIKNQLKARVERAQRMLRQFKEGTLSRNEEADWNAKYIYIGSHSTDQDCPACHSTGVIYGEEVEDVDVIYLGDQWGSEDVAITLTVLPDGFYCYECHLELDDWDLLVEAGLDESFQTEGDSSDIPNIIEYNNE